MGHSLMSLQASSSASVYIITALMVVISTAVLLRAVLPWLLQRIFKHKLKVHRFSLRGIHGLEWNRASAVCTSGETRGSGASGAEPHVRIDRIYISLARFDAQHGAPKSAADCRPLSTRSWITIHVQGVRATLPRLRHDEASTRTNLEKARDKTRKEEQSEREASERQERRLRALVQRSRSPVGGASAAAGIVHPRDRSHSSSEGSRAPSSSEPMNSCKEPHANPYFSLVQDLWRFVSNIFVPDMRGLILRGVKAVIFVVASNLPALASIVEIQVHAMEAFVQEANSVVLVDHTGVELCMDLVNPKALDAEADEQLQTTAASQPQTTIYDRFSKTFASVSGRIGASARDTSTYLMSGLPAGRCSARLRLTGLKLLEAQKIGSLPDQRNVLIVLPDLTRIHIGLLLGPSFRLKGQEAIEVHVKTSAVNINLDAAYRVARIVEERKGIRAGPSPSIAGLESSNRSGLTEHLFRQRTQPGAHALSALRALCISIPKIEVLSAPTPKSCVIAKSLGNADLDLLPDKLQLQAFFFGICLTICNSSPSDPAHQRWLGTCGVSDHQALSNRPKMQHSQTVHLVEHRRAFKTLFGIDNSQISCRLDQQRHRSELLHLGRLHIHARSTWTPFGILPSSSQSANSGPTKFFPGDPNEEVAMVDVTLQNIRGDLKLNCAQKLLSSVEMLRRERSRIRGSLQLDELPKRSRLQLLDYVPKIFWGLNIENTVYRLDAGLVQSSQTTASCASSYSNFILKVPSLSLVCHGAYQEACIQRSDAKRRAAWNAFRNDELEWSITSDNRRQGPRLTLPKVPNRRYSAFVDKMRSSLNLSDASGGPGNIVAEHENRQKRQGTSLPSGMPLPALGNPVSEPALTIEEAVCQIKRTQKVEKEDDEAPELCLPTRHDRLGVSRVVKIPARLTKGASAATREESTVRYAFDVNFDCPCIDGFFVFSDSESPSRCKRDGAKGGAQESRGEGSDDAKLIRRQFLVLNNISASANGFLPGIQDFITDRVTLKIRDQQISVRGLLEEIDIELWHPTVFAFGHKVAQGLYDAEALFRAISPSYGQQSVTGTPKQSTNAASCKAASSALTHPSISECIPGGLDVWLSVGAVLAHLGGSDPEYDPHICRGLRFETRSIAAEFSCQTKSGVLFKAPSSEWSHRSALQLPEDVKLSSTALATRHGKAAVGKLSQYDIALFPLLDIEAATQFCAKDLGGHHSRTDQIQRRQLSKRNECRESNKDATAVFGDAIWDFQSRQPAFETHARRRYHQKDRAQNFLFFMPYFATKLIIRPPGPKSNKVGKHVEEVTIVSEGTKLLSLKAQLLHIYCILLIAASLKSLSPKKRFQKLESEQNSPHAVLKSMRTCTENQRRLSIFVNLDISDVHVFIGLPENVQLFVHLRRLAVRRTEQEGISCSWESLMTAVESPHVLTTNLWEEAVRLRDWKVGIKPGAAPDSKMRVIVNGDGANVRIPFGYTVHPIIDAASIFLKATKQLVHQFIKGGTDSIITPCGEEPKRLPHIDIDVRVLTLEAQDDPFESRLNIIWRTGTDENRGRIQREEAFEAKIAQLRAEYGRESKQASHSTVSLGSSRSIYESSHDGSDNESAIGKTFSDDDIASGSPRSASILEKQIRAAKERLDAYNSSSWIRRYANAKAEQSRREDAVIQRAFGGYWSFRQAVELPIKMVQPHKSAPLLRSSMKGVKIAVRPISFPDKHLREWLHKQGCGTPKDLSYSLLVPLHLQLSLAEWIAELRDYPLPLLHIPPVCADQRSELPAFKVTGDICLAEHLSEGLQSIRHVRTVVIPAAAGRSDSSGFNIIVPKVTMPVKFYGSPILDFNSSFPTRFTWGQSLQPAISDVARVFDGITSPPSDPSPKLGFWDRLPLLFHGQILLRWNAGGELHLYLKGSRDPYSVLGNGAGWVMCWRGDVQVRIGFHNEDGEFLQFLSEEYVLAIPDLRGYQDQTASDLYNNDSGNGRPADKDRDKEKSERKKKAQIDKNRCKSDSEKEHQTELGFDRGRNVRQAQFSKVCMRLSQGVRWGASLRHEHTCRDGICVLVPRCEGSLFHRECRLFERRPHWTVIQRSGEFMNTLPKEKRDDSFYSWRSDFTHLGISIFSPENGLSAYGERWGRSRGTNNLYFSPLAWQHFWAWLRLFDSTMSLPVRQGKLFPNTPPPSPKFGRQLGTIKYRFDVAPLFISHVYHQHSRADWASGTNTLLGIKARLGVFHLDMHQRHQEMIKERPETQEIKRGYHKPFYEAEADFRDIDLRTLIGRFVDLQKQLVALDQIDAEDDFHDFFDKEEPEIKTEMHQDAANATQGWCDVQDFIEVDTLLPGEDRPKIRLLPALTCPRFNFYRRCNSRWERKAKAKSSSTLEVFDADQLERTKFGNECPQTHTCLIGQAPTPHQIQATLATERLKVLREELERGSLDEDIGNMSEGAAGRTQSEDARTRIRLIEEYIERLRKLEECYKITVMSRHGNDSQEAPSSASWKSAEANTKHNASLDSILDTPEMYPDRETFDDRFFVHNPVFFFSNETRYILFRYYASSKKRKGFIHNMTSRSILSIRQLSEHLKSSVASEASSRKRGDTDESKTGSELLTGLLKDAMPYVVTDVAGEKEDTGGHRALLDTRIDPKQGISDTFTLRRANVCVLLKPQIVMKSNMDDASTVVVTATRTRLQNYSVLDPTVADEDSVNRRVLTRNYFSLDGLQAFHPRSERTCFGAAHAHEKMDFVPLETLIDVKYETRDFDRIVSRTDASLHYDMFNRLRLNDSTRPIAADADNSDSAVDHLRHHMDLLRVRCPRFAVSANSTHFGALYNIVTDLILYRAPTWKEHSKQLEAMLLSYDFKDTALLADVVADLQMRIRRAVELDAQYQLCFNELNEGGRLALFELKAHLHELIEELLLITEAITASEDAKSDDEKDKKSALRIEAHAQDLSWNMMGESDGQLLAKLSIKGPSFTWLNKADSSASNSLSIVDLAAVNVDPEAAFPEIISKWNKAADHPMAKQGRMVNAIWSELAPVGGISIVDQFELELHPIKVQLEIKVGRMIMDYIFGSKRRREREEAKRKQRLEELLASTDVKTTRRGPLARLRGSTAKKSNSRASSPSCSTDVQSSEEHGKLLPSKDGSNDSGLTASSASSRDGTLILAFSRSSSASSISSSHRTSLSSDGDYVVGTRAVRPSGNGCSAPDPRGTRAPSSREREFDLGCEDSVNHSQHSIAKRNAEEMRQRASSNLTFVFFKLSETIFCLSFKGEKNKSITDVFDLVFKTPNIEYRNRTWTYEELVQHMKKDIFRAAWGQRTTIIKSILSHRPKRPEALKNIRDKQGWLCRTSRDSMTSTLMSPQFHVHPPTPQRSRDITPADLSATLGEVDDSDVDSDRLQQKPSPDGSTQARSSHSPQRSVQADSPCISVEADGAGHRHHRLGRFLHPRLGRAASPNSLVASPSLSDASHSESSSRVTLSGLRSTSPQRSHEQPTPLSFSPCFSRRNGPLDGERTIRAVSSNDGYMDSAQQRSSSKRFFRQTSNSFNASRSKEFLRAETQSYVRSDARFGNSAVGKAESIEYSRLISRRSVSKDDLQGVSDDQRPPMADAADEKADEKAAALFGSSRPRD